ncbi:hypothetical protein ElyMa_000000900 [Elysia marginata]|uniref:Transmembrane protein n=1 Tax=Elysia marginata TaxID=1093978 RepID=A0AAV4E7Y4_9GAST|nr:hypothetical protein ElyMa_000000900 [Elysia marginata]
MWNRRLLAKIFSDMVHLSHSRFHNLHNVMLPVAILSFFFSVCVADVDAEVFIGDDNDDGGDYCYDDFTTHVDDDDDELLMMWMQEKHMILQMMS